MAGHGDSKGLHGGVGLAMRQDVAKVQDGRTARGYAVKQTRDGEPGPRLDDMPLHGDSIHIHGISRSRRNLRAGWHGEEPKRPLQALTHVLGWLAMRKVTYPGKHHSIENDRV